MLAVLGNHDYFVWGAGVRSALEKNGYEVLRNQTTMAHVRGAPLAMVGVDDPQWEMDWCSVYSARALTLPDYVHGRVIFTGDAAHMLPIFGVRGANTGFQDCHDLVWKLAFTVRGWAGEGLLPSYSAERVHAAREIIEILKRTQGRAFVLFTSYANLREVRAIAEAELEFPILVQGTAPRSALLRDFKATPHAVLLATSSFWQGVDVVGEALSCVIIDKLPFAPPGDPIVAALPGGHTSKPVPDELLAERNVDTIVMLLADGAELEADWTRSRFSRGVERWLALSPFVGDKFEPVMVTEGRLRYVVLRRKAP